MSDYIVRTIVKKHKGKYIYEYTDKRGNSLKKKEVTPYLEGFYLPPAYDDVKIYKISGGNYPAPIGLMAEPGDSEAMLSWYDMNASGTDDFSYDDGSFSQNSAGNAGYFGTRLTLAHNTSTQGPVTDADGELRDVFQVAAKGTGTALYVQQVQISGDA